jgi:DNA-binding MarR family transcriptional regulator
VEADRIDKLVGQWTKQRPDLQPGVMAEVARLLLVARLIDGRIAAMAREYGLGQGEGDVLFTLRRAGPPFRLSPSSLAESLLVTSGTMTNRLDRLERRGLIRRQPNPEDRRGLDVELTAKARHLVDEAVTEHVANEESMLSGLSGRERTQLQRLLRKLLAHLSEAAD